MPKKFQKNLTFGKVPKKFQNSWGEGGSDLFWKKPKLKLHFFWERPLAKMIYKFSLVPLYGFQGILIYLFFLWPMWSGFVMPSCPKGIWPSWPGMVCPTFPDQWADDLPNQDRVCSAPVYGHWACQLPGQAKVCPPFFGHQIYDLPSHVRLCPSFLSQWADYLPGPG